VQQVTNKITYKKKPSYADHYTLMPNEIFEDLLSDGSNISKTHKPFAYGYLYYITHLYRYCLHYNIKEKQTQGVIKSVLGKSSIDKGIDYIIKEGGVLDLMGYTQTTQDYPIKWYMDEYDYLQFNLLGDSGSIIPFSLSDKNFKIKFPLKSFYRTQEDMDAKELTGTFYDASNSHKINFSIFQKCMSNPDLGVYAFYIYGYIKYKNGMFTPYNKSRRDFPTEINMTEKTLFKYIDALESNGLIRVDHQQFVGKGGLANGYTAL
jgi:hypothetical protein